MTKILRNPTTEEIIIAIEENRYDFYGEIEKEPKDSEIKCIKTKEYSILDSGRALALINSVNYTNFTQEQTEKKVEEVIEYFKERNLPFVWYTGVLTKSLNLTDLLVSKYGFIKFELPGMYINVKDLPKSVDIEDFEIIRIENKDQLEVWDKVLLESYHVPEDSALGFFPHYLKHKYKDNYSAFLGYYKGKPVAVSLVFYSRGVAGIYAVGNIEKARGRGIGTAITLAAATEPKEKGYEIVILHASEMGYNVYKRMGFEKVSNVYNLFWNPE